MFMKELNDMTHAFMYVMILSNFNIMICSSEHIICEASLFRLSHNRKNVTMTKKHFDNKIIWCLAEKNNAIRILIYLNIFLMSSHIYIP